MTEAPAVIRTPDQRIRVFVSSTLKELADERRAARGAIERLRLAPVMFELGARPHPPRELYRSYLAQSDVFVGIYADSYGWVAPDEDVSGLEDEYNLAPPAMPKLIYIKASAHRDDRLNELIDRIRADDTAAYLPFETPEQLEEQLVGDLATLLAERFDAAAAQASSAPPASAAVRMPPAYSRIIGRDREVADVLELVTSGRHRVVTLLGPGGIGKSRLAIEAASAAEPAFPDGTVFIALENVLEPDLLLPTIAYGLGIRDASERPLDDRLALALHGRRMLIVLDNFEQIVDAAAQVVRLYTLAPDSVFLVTSRIVLRIRGERVYEVPPLAATDAAAPGSVSRAAGSPAVELFVERARAMKPDFALTAGNTPAVVAVCQALDGLPLAIELAAARMRLLTPAAVLQRLDSKLRLLVDSSRDIPGRQRTLAATIEWSTGLLEEDERLLLWDLGVFSAGFTLDAVDAIGVGRVWAARAVGALEALIDGSLVSQSDVGGEAVFAMLATVREYSVQQLVERGEERAMRDAHARYIDALTRRVAPELTGPGQRVAAARLDLERGNLRTAVRHLTDVGDADIATDIAWRLYLYWWLRGLFYEVRLWMEELLARVPEPSDHARAVARFYYLWSEMWTTDRGAEVFAGLQEAADLFAATGDDAGAAMAHATEGLARATLGQPLSEVIPLLESSAASLRRQGLRWGETLALIALGRVAWAIGDSVEATRRFEAALASADDPFTQTVARHHLARMRLLGGDTKVATRGFIETMRRSMSLDHEEGIAYAVEGLCAVAASQGDVVVAATLAGAAETIRQRITMYDTAQFVYHLRYLDAATAPAEEAAVREAMRRGREMSALEAAEFALANIDDA
ncbi:ATP-binding protein [Microbacterium sp. P5_E9]